MATRTFPIFRSVQRALVGSAGAGKHKPALAAVAARNYQGKEEETKREDSEERSEPQLDSSDDVDEVILFNNFNKWPINSEKARQMRREFVQEGYRRLYSVASAQSLIVGDMYADANVGQNDEGVGIEAELRRATDVEESNAINEDERQLSTQNNGNEDWMFYAQ